MDINKYVNILLFVFISIHLISIYLTIYKQNELSAEEINERNLPNYWSTTTFNIIVMIVLIYYGIPLLIDRFSWDDNICIIIIQLIILLIINDTWFYWWHRSLHRIPFVKKYVHDTHHTSHNPLATDYIYANIIEVIGGAIGLLPLFLITKVNGYSFLFINIIRQLHELEIHHSKSKKSIFFGLNSPYNHNLHHEIGKNGNYGSTFPFWDTIMDTKL